jgi:hypothetical protein
MHGNGIHRSRTRLGGATGCEGVGTLLSSIIPEMQSMKRLLWELLQREYIERIRR